MKASSIGSATDLAAWLAGNGIDTTVWGKDGAKTVADLWLEVAHGESTLTDDPPRRAVTVVQITLRQDSTVLLELGQELRDGQVRSRVRPPSEKIKANEVPHSAALRCLVEELGLSADEVEQIGLAADAEITELDSPSYPGLKTTFTIYLAEAQTSALPDEDFWRDNVGAGDSDPIVRYLWGWRPNV